MGETFPDTAPSAKPPEDRLDSWKEDRVLPEPRRDDGAAMGEAGGDAGSPARA